MFWGCSLVCGAHLLFASRLFILSSFTPSFAPVSVYPFPQTISFFLFKWRKIFSLQFKAFPPLLPFTSLTLSLLSSMYSHLSTNLSIISKPTKDIMKQRKMHCSTKSEDRWWGAGIGGTKTERIMKTGNDADQEKLERDLSVQRDLAFGVISSYVAH